MRLRALAAFAMLGIIVALVLVLVIGVQSLSTNFRATNDYVDTILTQRSITRDALQREQDSNACFTKTLNEQLLALDDVVLLLDRPPAERDPVAMDAAFKQLQKARADAADANTRCVDPYKIPTPEPLPTR